MAGARQYSHVTDAQHGVEPADLARVTSIEWEAIVKISPLADGELTPVKDVIGVRGTIRFDDDESAVTFLNNDKSDLVCVAKVKGQETSSTLTFVNAVALSERTGPVATAFDPFATCACDFQADSYDPTDPA